MKLKFCPKCKSINVSKEINSTTFYFGMPARWKCNNCGYANLIFPDVTKKYKIITKK